MPHSLFKKFAQSIALISCLSSIMFAALEKDQSDTHPVMFKNKTNMDIKISGALRVVDAMIFGDTTQTALKDISFEATIPAKKIASLDIPNAVRTEKLSAASADGSKSINFKLSPDAQEFEIKITSLGNLKIRKTK